MQLAKSSNINNPEFTFVDLRTQWNQTLLKRFYDEFLVPNFGIIPDELDPLETWIEALQDPKPEDIVAHVIIAFENSQPSPSENKIPQLTPSTNPRIATPPPALPPRPPTTHTNLQKTLQRKNPTNDFLVKNPTVSSETFAECGSVSETSTSSSESLTLIPTHEVEYCEQCEREAESSALLTTNATVGTESNSRLPPRPHPPHHQHPQRRTLRMVGGCCFEYCIASNSMLLSYFCVHPRMRGKGLARRLADAAERIADYDARQFRQLPRCDAFYLETNKLSVAVKHRDVMNPRTRHQILYNIGFRALNFHFVQPPLSAQSQPFDGLWLCVRLSSPHIITQQQKEQLEQEITATSTNWAKFFTNNNHRREHTSLSKLSSNHSNNGQSVVLTNTNNTTKRYYMPSSFVKKFIVDYWMSCVGTWKSNVHMSTEKELREMLEELNTKPFVELLELPWDETNPAVAASLTDRSFSTVPSSHPSQHLPLPPPPPPPRLPAKL